MTYDNTNLSKHALFKDLTWLKINMLKVISYAWKRNGKSYWVCECECWKIKDIRSDCITRWQNKSCWCLTTKTHGMSKSDVYNIYLWAKQRCNNKNIPSYSFYGWRWIKFNFISFEQFTKVVWERPGKGYSLDRINNNGNYEPWNVRWATRKQQNRNTRNNIRYSYNWKSKTLWEWGEETWINSLCLWHRINGRWWSIKDALNTEINTNYNKRHEKI